MTGPLTFRYAGECGTCEAVVKMTRSHVVDGNPEAEWVRCGDCESITRIPFVRSEEAL
jgi:hypothetical protein